MIITGIPFDEKLNIGVLSKVFERKRISNCYKYFWFQAILENIVEDKVVFTYDEILNQMIEDAWYMVTEFKLRLGPCNTTDNLEEVVKYIHSKSNISSTAKRGSVIQYLKENTDPKIKEIYQKVSLKDKPISIDHFVPWQYLSHDELWNLSPTTKNINSMKGNQLPNLYEDFERLAELQHKALMMCNDYEIVRHKFKICLDYHVNSTEIRNSLYQPDIDLPSYRERLYNVIQPVYDSAKMGGFTEWIK